MTPSTSKPAKLLTSLWMRLSWGAGEGGGMPEWGGATKVKWDTWEGSKEGKEEGSKAITEKTITHLKGYLEFELEVHVRIRTVCPDSLL